MNSVICNRPGCVSMVAYDGARYCSVHAGDLSKGRTCAICHGTGWEHANFICGRCGGTGLLDKHRGESRVGKDRRKQKVDARGLIKAAE